MLDDADIAIVISGGHAVTCRAAIRRLREQGVKIGMARLLWIRPFPSEDLRAALRGVKAVGVVETNLGLGGSTYGGILAPDVTTALYHAENRPLVTSFMAGLGGETVPDRRVRVDGRQADPGGRARPRREASALGGVRGLMTASSPTARGAR